MLHTDRMTRNEHGATRENLEHSELAQHPGRNVLEPGPQPDDRINVLVESEVAYWTRELGVPRERLAEAIGKVGGRVADIRAFFAAPAH